MVLKGRIENERGSMLLSIVIPVYNLEEYLARCLDSIISQNYDKNNYEIIIVNDGSTDGSQNVIDGYANKYENVSAIYQENSGVSEARNKGLKVAKGEYVWFIDGDDYISKGSLAYLSGIAIKENPDYILFSYTRTKQNIDIDLDLRTYKVNKSTNGYVNLESCYAAGVCFYWMKKSILDTKNILFNKRLKYAEDALFINQLKAYSVNVIATEAPIYFYFQRSSSAMHKIDHQIHCSNMFLLSMQYQQLLSKDDLNTFARTKTEKNKIRAFQHCLTELCLYCKDKKTVKQILLIAKKEGILPCKIDWGNFRINKKQSRQSDLMNWAFGCVVKIPYFWLCWFVCGIVFKKKRTAKFDLEYFCK